MKCKDIFLRKSVDAKQFADIYIYMNWNNLFYYYNYCSWIPSYELKTEDEPRKGERKSKSCKGTRNKTDKVDGLCLLSKYLFSVPNISLISSFTLH